MQIIFEFKFSLRSLSELVLSRNQIVELPPTFGLLTNLRAVNLDENEISYLPPDV